MRAGRVNNVTAQGNRCRGTGGNGAAVAPVTWTGASGTGHTESQNETQARGDVTTGVTERTGVM